MLECSGIHFQHSLHQQSQVTDVTLGLKNTHRQWHMNSITNLINCHKDCSSRIMQLHQRDYVYSHNTSKSLAITHWKPLVLLNLKSKVLVGFSCELRLCYAGFRVPNIFAGHNGHCVRLYKILTPKILIRNIYTLLTDQLRTEVTYVLFSLFHSVVVT